MQSDTPNFSFEQADEIAESRYGLNCERTRIPSERDQNFLCRDNRGRKYVLKIANAADDAALLDGQNRAMDHVAKQIDFCPQVIPTQNGERSITVAGQGDRLHMVRVISFIDGTPLANLSRRADSILRDLGKRVAQLNIALQDFDHPSFRRKFDWNLAIADRVISQHISKIKSKSLRAIIEKLLGEYESNISPYVDVLKKSVIHNDANDGNVIVSNGHEDPSVVGIIDFGDMVYSYSIADLAVAIAYAVLEHPNPLAAAACVVRGYSMVSELEEGEFACLFAFVRLRLCVSACMAAFQQSQNPNNEYLSISQNAINKTLPELAEIPLAVAEQEFRNASVVPTSRKDNAVKSHGYSPEQLLNKRMQLMGTNLSTSYATPLKIVKGSMQYLFDEKGRRYLDAFNNVPHVGHCHPHVVEVAGQQISKLNTNTRYLHDLQVEYAERLIATLPDPLNVCYFVNSASEANELAIRMARAYTARKDMIVLENAYHGNTTTLIELSPYKYNGPGGDGPPDWVHEVGVPDVFRGVFRSGAPDIGQKYAQLVENEIDSLSTSGRKICGFIAESSPSVAGQIMLPQGYLKAVYASVRASGGVCIADEVQTGYGRIGSEFYSFESQHVIPDIVVLGKPIGNGHPIGAVITTAEIAEAFDCGMEYFSTFGGNTVSCAIGLAVLEVIEAESLQDNSQTTGAHLLAQLKQLQSEFECIGDVRGSGFFIGVELVQNRADIQPDSKLANRVVNELCRRAILIGTDGPDENVLKIRPPMQFNMENANHLVENLREVLRAAEN